MKKICLTACLLLLWGSVFLCCGNAGHVRSGVTVGDLAVGGLPVPEAVALARKKIADELLPLTVHTPAGDFTVRYPELSFQDDLPVLLKKAKKGENVEPNITRTWADAEARLEEICLQNARAGVNAELNFSAQGFTYRHEQNGLVCDYSKLLSDCFAALNAKETDVTLRVRERPPAITEEKLRARSVRLSSYTTSFNASNATRSHNIRLAASRIAGTTVPAGGEFSFNAVVGKRTAENGFQSAPVILEGEFVQGVGGGVCQASTTLFNAALRAGMRISESHPHSLSVSYVPPSLDAMVSEYSDMRFVNPYAFPVFVQARTTSSSVTFELYGASDGRRYETESRVLERIAPPPAKIAEEGESLKNEKEGMKSESYLAVYEGDTLVSRTRIRRDSYASVQGVVAPPPEEVPKLDENPEETLENFYFAGQNRLHFPRESIIIVGDFGRSSAHCLHERRVT